MGSTESGQDISELGERLRVDIAEHENVTVGWRQSIRGGSREDRMLSEIVVSLPPKIRDYAPPLSSLLMSESDGALASITRLDTMHGEHLGALSTLLLRAESVASSRIERIDASVDDFVRAAYGSTSNHSAMAMVASSTALDSLIVSAGSSQKITAENILQAHHLLLKDDMYEAAYAGKFRDMQNWVGGSNHSPRGALYVPPPPETVDDYIQDLLDFANRDDVPVLTQAAITHAQFESIHPFTDGNGRIGRALINAILRRRGTTLHVVVPLASALVAHKAVYFDVLTTYRQGNAGPIIRAFTRAAHTSTRQATSSSTRISQMSHTWLGAYLRHEKRKPRSGSAVARMIDELPRTPVFRAEDMVRILGGAPSSVYGAIDSLSRADILRPLTQSKRDQIWCAAAIVDELEDLGVRIADETQKDPFWQELHRGVLSQLRRNS